MPRSKRLPIHDHKGDPIPGIWRVDDRLYAKKSVGSGKQALQREKSFELGTSVKEIRAWQESTRLELLALLPTVTRGTLAADVPIYLEQQRHKASYAAKKSELGAWVAALGTMKRHQIRGSHIAATIATWLGEDVSKKTILSSTLGS